MKLRRANFLNRQPMLWKWEWVLVFVVGLFLWMLLIFAIAPLPYREGILIRIGLISLLFPVAAAMYVAAKRYLLAGVLAMPAAILSFELWLETDAYAFVSQPYTLHFWTISLTVALLAMGVVLLVVFSNRRRRRFACKRTAVSLLTVVCAGVLIFAQCEVFLTHLNAACDRSESTPHTCTVEGNWKEVTGRKFANKIILLLNKDGETIRLNRSWTGRVEFASGDVVVVQEYGGAFAEPYYFLEEEF